MYICVRNDESPAVRACLMRCPSPQLQAGPEMSDPIRSDEIDSHLLGCWTTCRLTEAEQKSISCYSHKSRLGGSEATLPYLWNCMSMQSCKCLWDQIWGGCHWTFIGTSNLLTSYPIDLSCCKHLSLALQSGSMFYSQCSAFLNSHTH